MAIGNFIIRNIAAPAASVEIADLGITLAAGTDRDLHDFEFHEIATSYDDGDLGAAITADDIVLLDSDGVTALTKPQTQALFDAFFDVSLARTLRTIVGDTGTFTVDAPNATFSLLGAGGLTVDISGGTITLDATAISGTVTSVAATPPAAGLTITGSPITTSGTFVFALANDLAALEGLAGTGIAVRSAVDTWVQRSLVQPAAGITISNSDGVAGNPTFALANDLSALEGLGSTGFAVRSAADTWVQRSLVAPAAGITISNPAGIAGDPTFALANDLAGLEGLAGTGFAVRTAADTWTNRTITGTAARITLTNGSGIAGDPTIDIAATYVGQTSITTLGTITTGTWNGTTVATGFGGTGLTTIGTANQVLGVNAGAGALEYKSFVAGTDITIVHGVGTITINSTAASSSLQLYKENPVAPAAPTATGTNAVAIGTGASASGSRSIAIGNGTSATGADAIVIGDGSAAGADTMAIGFDAVASGGNHAAVFGGNANTSTGNASTVLGGNNNLASAQSSVAIGERSVSDLFGGFAQAAGRFATDGDAQTRVVVLRTQTTTAAVTEAFLDGTGGTARMVLPNDTTWAFRILVSARRTDADNSSAVYQFVGGIDRNATAASTAIVGAVSKTVVAEDVAAWDCNVNADTTNGSLRIQVTGAAGSTIRWVARVELVEVTG